MSGRSLWRQGKVSEWQMRDEAPEGRLLSLSKQVVIKPRQEGQEGTRLLST